MSASDYQYSMVLDWLGSHPYQAEVLLFTLEAFANVPRRQMVVQCTDRVSDDVIAKLSAQGYTVTTIAPYLDQAYCNKIAQLDYFVDSTDSRGVFLLDLDLAILAELDIPDRDVVCGKVVDGANPPLDTLERLFDAAGIELPAIMPSDWEGRGDTIATNLNGGFLYVPRPYIEPLRNKWRHWAEFLFAKPDLFDHPSARKHIDQIAFGMALASARIPFRHLPTNWNYPGHKDRVPRGYRRDEPLRVLHYHDRVGRFGLIDAAEFDGAAVEDAVNRVNSVLAARDARSLFYDLHREDMALRAINAVPALPASIFSDAFIARTWIGDHRRRLILHAGTPKTGTWSLQFHLGTHRRELMAEGWWFPAPSDTPEPKHQQVNALLRRDDPDGFVRYVESALADMPDDAHTVLLTTEGIFNHWWDYAPRAKGVLRQLAALFDFELCVWFRPPEDFAAALYAQYLRNPRRPTESMGNVYGRDIDFTEALADGWFRGHLDYLGFYREAQALFGASRVKAFRFADDTVTTFLEHYCLRGLRDLHGLPAEAARRNTSLGRAGVDLMRIANRHALGDDEQARVADLVRDIDTIVGDRAERFRLTHEERELVQRFSAPGWRTLQPLLHDGSTLARRGRTGRGVKVGRSTIQFAVRCGAPSGGALKLRHYFEHALASPILGHAAVHMPADTRWSAANTWIRHRDRVTDDIDWPTVRVVVISGWGWDRFIPQRFHKAPPFQVVYLVQSFGRIDPRDSQFRHLANPAIRICVSRPLEAELRRLDVANGPIHTIPAGIETSVFPAPRRRNVDVLIVGFKMPTIARGLAASLAQSGIAATMLMEKGPRGDFLELLGRARVVVCLPAVREGFYLPALEAMAVGAVTVCPDARGNDYCEDGVNCFQPEYRVDALAAAAVEATKLPWTQAAKIRREAFATARRHDYAVERRRFQAVLRDALRAPGTR